MRQKLEMLAHFYSNSAGSSSMDKVQCALSIRVSPVL